MEVIIDGQRNFEVEGRPESVMEVLGAVEEHLRAHQRGMLSLRVDGEEVPPNQVQARLEPLSPQGVKTLEITSEELGVLVESVLASLRQVLPELPKACRDLAKVFQGDSPEDGYEPFHQLAQIWSHIKSQERLVVDALELDLDALTLEGKTGREMHEALNQYLEEAASALKSGDTVLLGDLLEYELAPRAEEEAALVALLRESAPASSG